ncbi:hypothetical protein [Paractinoplanes hotanensis]|uniref:Uncharacterized protein n=1 Tax=Paractinoplanes hotanensis TaxID=2906497 RepID=A0ABT0Y4U8_9ACTN|nr:hypothetical protein [Actinoplanes hotanensis]MCM4081068.1 hypothetical protein [Actinoplanes hotanensis]
MNHFDAGCQSALEPNLVIMWRRSGPAGSGEANPILISEKMTIQVGHVRAGAPDAFDDRMRPATAVPTTGEPRRLRLSSTRISIWAAVITAMGAIVAGAFTLFD